ncbi:PTS fructose-like transporter subunit IIB [Thiocystis violacea]|uniref:PTS fructose-like transporter subunit IIB n=1 Tax=Thiocystis violacea TaxID=13725 RepID=UPI0019063757|nr:PTS fructose-like transporter subunit IIB [Thiocystis violacea]MBK1719952.1 PTS fructose transporter subunit EIIBC [Thiocystis violacea]
MAKLIAVTSCPTGIAHSLMAAEAIKRTADLMGHAMQVEIHGAEGTTNRLSDATIAAADAVLIAADIHVEIEPFGDKPMLTVSTGRAIRETQAVLGELLALVPGLAATAPPVATEPAATQATAQASGRRIVAITACPTGIAHTFMAADALKKAAVAAGDSISVETQGSVGAKNQLTDEDIATADLVIIAADTHVDPSRFAGKLLYSTSVGAAVKGAADVITKAKTGATIAGGTAPSKAAAEKSSGRKMEGAYKHLLTGVSYMLPIVVAGGLCIALSFVFGIEAFKEKGTIAAALMDIGGGAAFKLMIPILSGYIAYSIADRPGLTPGLIGGMLAMNLEAGFLGGIISGFLAGYIALLIRDWVKLPQNFEGLKPVLVIPLLSTLAVGLLMIYVVGAPVKTIMETMTAFLQGMGSTNAVILGLILGGMMAVDMGGPINKAAYTFAVGLLTSDTFMPMAAVMAAGMTPPLGIAIATLVGRSRFTQAEREAGKAAGVLGLSFITEGAIPFAAKDPLRVIPAAILGSAAAGAISMYFEIGLRAPHGGVFVLAIPNAVSDLGWYAAAIAIGALITATALLILKPSLEEPKATELAGAANR